MGATQLLARHVMNHSAYDLLPDEVVATAKEMMLNAAAVALAAAAQPDGQRITQFVQEMGGNGNAPSLDGDCGAHRCTLPWPTD